MGRKCNSSHGFTLVELLIAMAVVVTLAALAIPSLISSIDNAHVARAMGDIDALEGDIEAYDQLNGKMRKDRFLVPINSTYDLYSMGKDGQSVPPITAKVSQDDIIRANDGAYLGLASNY